MERAGDGGHGSARIAISFAVRPGLELVGEIWGGLSGERRVADIAASVGAMAAGARRYAALRIAHVVEHAASTRFRQRVCPRLCHGERRIVGSDLLTRIAAEAARDPFHLRVAPRTGREVFELAKRIAPIQPGKARREVAVALPLGAVTGRASPRGPRPAATERDGFAGVLERVSGERGRGTAAQRKDQHDQEGVGSSHRHRLQPVWRAWGSALRGFAAATVLAATVGACKPPPEARHDRDPAAVDRGRALAAASGCAACHAFPDIAWPKGRTGPSLSAFDGRGPIAGSLSNTPANLAAFVRNAPRAKPGSTMPAMPLTPTEARDVAAYLYGIADD